MKQDAERHALICKENRNTMASVMIHGLNKDDVIELGNLKGGDIIRRMGYPFLTSYALALQVSRDHLISTLRNSYGNLSYYWYYWLKDDEKLELGLDIYDNNESDYDYSDSGDEKEIERKLIS
jgi:hypothetical protein